MCSVGQSSVSIQQSFRSTWTRDPFAYQVRLAEVLLSGQNAVLVAPTGAGKTWAALHPFVHARLSGEPWADRLIYALPLRTLAGALYSDGGVQAGLGRAGLRVTMQTGLHKDDPAFEGDVCFATIDQVLSAYVGDPVSVSRRQANLAGGALVGSYVVFDEVHLLEKPTALATALDLAARLQGLASVLVMTATAPDSVVDYLGDRLKAEIVMPTRDEIASMPAQASRERYYDYRPEPLTPETIIETHLASERHKTVAVFNTVGRAQDAFQKLRTGLPPGHRPLLLHSRFLASDRRDKELEALDLLREDSEAKVLLVSTQVIEVGLNISCENLLTELAPASSLVQRAGRCARFKGERGTVCIYEVPSEAARPFAPYPDHEGEATRRVLEARFGQGPVRADPAWERAFVDEALGSLDKEAIAAISPAARSSEVAACLSTDSRAAYRTLVRRVDATSVTIHSRPDALHLRRGLEAFGVSDPVLAGFLRSLDLDGAHKGCVVYPEWNDEASEDEDAPVVKRWVPVGSRDVQTAMGAQLLVVHPSVAAYDTELGLRLGEPGTWEAQSGGPAGQPSETSQARGTARPGESFRRHALDVARRVRSLGETRTRAALTRLGRAHGVEPEVVCRLAELAATLHDFGKLDRRWQRGIWEEHRAAGGGPTPPPSETEARLLAHSAQPSTEKTAPRRLRPHAVCGACASYLILKEVVPAILGTSVIPESQSVILGGILAAIARHHHPYSIEFDGFDPDAGYEAELRVLLADAYELPLPRALARIEPEQGRSLMRSVFSLVEPGRPGAWALYWALARLIRLADQASQRDLEGMPRAEHGQVLLSASLEKTTPEGR